MDFETLMKRNRKIIEQFGLGNTFESLVSFMDPDIVAGWQEMIANKFDIDLD